MTPTEALREALDQVPFNERSLIAYLRFRGYELRPIEQAAEAADREAAGARVSVDSSAAVAWLDHGFMPRPEWAGTCPRCGALAGEDCAVLTVAPLDVDALARLQSEIALYRWALDRIVAQDYRGNEPESHRIARTALSAYPPAAEAEDPCTHDPQDCMCTTLGHESCCGARRAIYLRGAG